MSSGGRRIFSGWRQLTKDPKTASKARFRWDPKSWSQEPWYFVYCGRPLTGAPPLLKTRKHMRRNDARKLWLALKERG